MKPLIIGEDNPYGGDQQADMALYPLPEGCSGWRLCHVIMGMRKADYVRLFNRINLCQGPWDKDAARMSAATALIGPGSDRLILCGSKVAEAFGLKYLPFAVRCLRMQPMIRGIMIPHPSGRCRAWPDMIAQARQALAGFVGEEIAGHFERDLR